MKKSNKTVVATAGNVPRSLRSGRSISAVPHFRRWAKKMKIHKDPSAEFRELPQTRYQRYALYRLETASLTNPWKPIAAWMIIMILGFISAPGSEIWWYYLLMTFIFAATIGEIYFCRAVLVMMRRAGADNSDLPNNKGCCEVSAIAVTSSASFG